VFIIRGNHWLTFGYKLTKNLKLSAGSNNLLNIYPTKQDEQGNTSGGYWDAVQMGFSNLLLSRLSYSKLIAIIEKRDIN
jgi:hypothetical protein